MLPSVCIRVDLWRQSWRGADCVTACHFGCERKIMNIKTPIDERYTLQQQQEQPRKGKTHWRLLKDGKVIRVLKHPEAFGTAYAWAVEIIRDLPKE